MSAQLPPQGAPDGQAAPLRIAHVITGLEPGGAETMLLRLLQRSERAAFQPFVISLTSRGALADEIAALDVPVQALGMRRGRPAPFAVLRLAAWLRTLRPHLIHTWLYHADLVGGLANRLAPRRPLLWHIHNMHLPRDASKRTTVWTAQLCARLSRWLPQRIVCCAEASCRLHAGLGYDASRMSVIPNGFALERFRPDPAQRHSLRDELGLPADSPLVGMVARWDPVKGHRDFLAAAAQVHAQRPDVHFVLCGAQVTPRHAQLGAWIDAHGLRGHVHLLGHRTDLPRIYAALDLLASASLSEAFPNVLGEAMACGMPCCVTDVGDSALIVGDTGRVVPPGQPSALAAACLELLALAGPARSAMGEAARQRIAQQFELGAVVRRFEALYREMTRDVRN